MGRHTVVNRPFKSEPIVGDLAARYTMEKTCRGGKPA
jgi:hypothetical protein